MKCLFVNKNWFDLNILYPLDKHNWTEQQTLPLEAFTVKNNDMNFVLVRDSVLSIIKMNGMEGKVDMYMKKLTKWIKQDSNENYYY